MDADIAFLPLTELAGLLRARELSPVEVTRHCLERIARFDPALNAFITVTAESALREAALAEQEIASGRWRGPLHGVPIALKDLIDTAGVPTTAGSRVFAGRVPAEDAAVVTCLRAAGAVLLGKLNLHEFAYGGSGVISAFGAAHNPWDLTRITGGSSSGSAAAVAAGLCYAAVGTDTAGSIRVPAACCGIVGLKPTYGLVSAEGVVPLAVSYDYVGPLARTVADCAAVLSVLVGEDFTPAPAPIAELRLGIPRGEFCDGLSPAVRQVWEGALELWRSLGAEITEFNLEHSNDRALANAEALAYHAPMLEHSSDLYDPRTLARIRAGRVLSEDELQRLRAELARQRERVTDVFRTVDLLVTPTMPVVAPEIAVMQGEDARASELLLLRNTRPFNVLALPALSLPCGVAEGLPVGIQLAGPPHSERALLGAAAGFEAHCGGFAAARESMQARWAMRS